MKVSTAYGQIGLGIQVHGKEAREFPHDGNTFVWARPGTEYSIVAWNYTDRRVEVVITVDGLDIIAGKIGNYTEQRGYVISAQTKPRAIPGFRLSEHEVARFKFSAPGDSYAALTDRPNNIGVIGAAFFAERVYRPIFRDSALFSFRDNMRGGGLESFGLNSKGVVPSVGTEFGRRTEFETQTTSFVRENHNVPLAVLALHYHTKERLRELGVDVDRPTPQVANPFPALPGDGCTPPPNWKG